MSIRTQLLKNSLIFVHYTCLMFGIDLGFKLGQVKKLGHNIIFVKKSYRNTRHKIITEHISSRADEIF